MEEVKKHTPTPDNMARLPWKISQRPSHEAGRRSMPWRAVDCDGAVVAHFASSMAAQAACGSANAVYRAESRS